MKRLIYILAALLMSLPAISQESSPAAGVVFEHGPFSEVMAKAVKNKKGPKLIFMDCYTTWCGPCKFMTNTIFPMQSIGDFMNKNFVNVKYDMEKGEGIELAKKYNVKAYPTFLILDLNGNEVNRIVGSSQDGDSFITRVKQAMDPSNSPAAKKSAYLKEKSAESAAAYMKSLEESYQMADLKSFAIEYFSTLKPEDKYTLENWNYFTLLIEDPESDSYKSFMGEKQTAEKYLTKAVVDKSLSNILMNYTVKYVAGRLKNVDTARTLSIISDIKLIENKNESLPYFLKIADLYTKKSYADITSLLKVPELMMMNEYNRYYIEMIISSIKGIDKATLAEYYKAKSDYLLKQSESAKTQSEKFLK